MRMWAAVAMLVMGCEYRSRVFPDGGLNPNHKLVLCSTERCERPFRRSQQSLQSTCSERHECVPVTCDDAGQCQGFCFEGSLLNGDDCDDNGCCSFSCDGFVGFQCPEAMNCHSSSECCDVPGTCSR